MPYPIRKQPNTLSLTVDEIIVLSVAVEAYLAVPGLGYREQAVAAQAKLDRYLRNAEARERQEARKHRQEGSA